MWPEGSVLEALYAQLILTSVDRFGEELAGATVAVPVRPEEQTKIYRCCESTTPFSERLVNCSKASAASRS